MDGDVCKKVAGADTAFFDIAQVKIGRCLAICRYIAESEQNMFSFTRPLLGEIFSHCTQLVEFFDACGARNNEKWNYLRHLMAVGKLFASSGYGLLHIKHALKVYKLIDSERDIKLKTEDIINFNSKVLFAFAKEVVRESSKLGLKDTHGIPDNDEFVELWPKEILPQDIVSLKVCSSEETIARLATAFLNLAAEAELLHSLENVDEDEYYSYIPNPLSEERLRILEHKFHNLQSMYDTYISNTNTESLDSSLSFLRGHVSIIYHLLELSTQYCHYYERHLCVRQSENFEYPLVDASELVAVIVDYFLSFSSEYLKNAVQLCQKMLSRYAEKGSVTVPVPKYRGFHVRPSTLVAKICLHYGSEVKMTLGDEEYDASAPLDLFRANEFINAVKRRRLAAEVADMRLTVPDTSQCSLTEAVRNEVYQLSIEQRIVLYENPVPIREFDNDELEDELFSQLVLTEITRLLAMGKLDIESELSITFSGDVRVLRDLQILANHGYGEDEYGNNISLPHELSYLKR